MYTHARAPVRIGIAGGGSDLPAWTRERDGLCLSLAIKLHVHAVVIDRPDKQVVASYSHLDRAACATEIANGLVRESALLHGFEDSFEVHTLSQVPSHGAGLGVSSAIAVALAAAFDKANHLDESEDDHHADLIARQAWTVEIDRLRRPIGRQDHMAAAHGGLRLYRFTGANASVEQTFTAEDAAWVARHLLLVQLPDGHDSRAILSGVQRAEQVRASFDAIEPTARAIENQDATLLGGALLACHASKATIPGAIPRAITEICAEILDGTNVAYGLKIAGAGGGGHLVVACNDAEDDCEKLHQATGLPVSTVEPDLQGVRSEGWR